LQPLVYYDGSGGAKRALLAAAQLARAGRSGITVLIAVANGQEASAMQKEVASLLKGGESPLRYLRIDSKDEKALLRALKAEKAGVLVLGDRVFLGRLQQLEALLSEVNISLLFLGDGAGESN
jgi:nucleotide-binding universal stress UspA family protein